MSRLFDRLRGGRKSSRPDQVADPTRPLDRRGPDLRPDARDVAEGGVAPPPLPPGAPAPGYGNQSYPPQDVRQGTAPSRSQVPPSQIGVPHSQPPAGTRVSVALGRGGEPARRQDPAFAPNLPPKKPGSTQQGAPQPVSPYPVAPQPGTTGAGAAELRADARDEVEPTSAPRGRGKSKRKAGRDRSSRKLSGSAPIVEAGSVTGRSLTLVITIMCFLACLTAGAVYLINQSASAWMKDIASEVTVQIQPRENGDISKRVTQVAFFLAKQRGISGVRPLTVDESAKLLEPWLGQSGALKELPVPRLIAIELDRRAPPNFERLRKSLTAAFPDAALDDHRLWQTQIRTVTRSMALGGLLILILVAAATTAIIVSATRSAMASNKEIVEVLHFVGATDRFIAREFEKHFLTLGIRAGLVGALSAMVVFFTMPSIMRMLGGGVVTQSELRRLVGAGALDMPGYFLLGIVVIVIAALCMLTSRYGVFRILNSQS